MRNKFQRLIRKAGYKIEKIEPHDDSELYRKIYGADSVNRRAFYNVAAGGHYGFGGKFEHSCWTNVDVEKETYGEDRPFNPEKDISYDLLDLKPLPIESNSAELVFSQYTIEHITNEAAENFFKEAYRVLKPGGVLRIVVPNAELDYIAYQNNDISYFDWIPMMSRKEVYEDLGLKKPLNSTSFEQVMLVHFAANTSTLHVGGNPSRISDDEFKEVMRSLPKQDAFDYCTGKCSVDVQRQFRRNHINWWNHEKLNVALKKSGFPQSHILAPGQSSIQVFRNQRCFDNLWNYVALFVEAVK